MELNFYLNYNKIPAPRNWKELTIEVNFDKDKPGLFLSATSFEFIGVTAGVINQWIASGTTNGVGIYEGIPFRVEVCDTNEVVLDGILDLVSPDAEYTCDIVTIPIKERAKIDWVNDVADSFSFAYLASNGYNGTGKILLTDYKAIPYCVSAIPNYTQALITGMSIFIMTKELVEATDKITGIIAQFTGDTITAAASAGVSAATLAATIARVVLLLAYFTLLVIAIAKLLQQLVDNIIQKKKYKYGMYVKDLFVKGSAHLGLQFSSTILQNYPYDKLTIIPQKIIIPTPNVFPQTFIKDPDETQTQSYAYGYYDGTFGDLIRSMVDYFDGEVRVINNTLYFEQKTYWQNQAAYTLPNIKTSTLPNGFNADELASNLFLTYALDDSDLNTYDEYAGTNAQIILQPNSYSDKKNILLKHLNETRIPFALGKRKESLTIIEQKLSEIINIGAGAINKVTDLINAATSVFSSGIQIPAIPTNVFAGRIGWLKLSSDFIGVNKLVMLSADNSISYATKTYLDAGHIMTTFHAEQLATRGNQYYTYKNREIPMCCEDFKKIKGNNIINTFDQQKGRIDSLKWNLYKETATIDYRIKKNYTGNLNETLILDGRF